MKSNMKVGIAPKNSIQNKENLQSYVEGYTNLILVTPINFSEGLGSPKRKVIKPVARKENISSTMVLHKHVYGADTRFTTM